MRHPSLLRSSLFAFFGLMCGIGAAHAQCEPVWLPGEGGPGVDGDGAVMASTTWDPDGAGPLGEWVVAAGNFWAAEDTVVEGIAAWDGSQWHTIGTGMWGIYSLVVHNGELLAGGGFTTTFGAPADFVARFDGTNWVPLAGGGMNHVVRALEIHDGQLVAAGFFTQAGGKAANHVARWDGASWSPVGGGLSETMVALQSHGGALFASGTGVHRWNGAVWQQVASATGSVEVLGSFSGELVAGGTFTTIGGVPAMRIATWDGSAWKALGAGLTDFPRTFEVFQDQLYVGGHFLKAGGLPVNRFARWDGSSWSGVFGGAHAAVWTLAAYGGELIVGGTETKPSGLAGSHVSRFDGASWGTIGTGINAVVYAAAEYQGEIYIGGAFSTAGDVVTTGIARRGSFSEPWQDVGGGMNGYVSQLTVFEGSLIAGGAFTSAGGVPANGIARWDGQTWNVFAPNGGNALHVHEGRLYTVGDFGTSDVAVLENGVWQPVGSFPPNVGMSALTTHAGDLIAGGVGGIGAASSVFRWDGAVWQPMGPAFGLAVQALQSYNGDLVAGGQPFSFTGDAGIYRWNGSTWEPLGGGLGAAGLDILIVFDLLIHNGELVVAGQFNQAGSTPVLHVARWNGTGWLPMSVESPVGPNDAAVGLASFGSELVVGGWFTMVGDQPSARVARWGCESAPCYPDCDQSGGLNIDDFICFQTLFALSDPSADCDQSGGLNIDDFICFQTVFAVGC